MKFEIQNAESLKYEIPRFKRDCFILQKKDLTDEDTLIIHEKQDEVMKKLTEFEQITRKLQRLLGLSDISSTTFAKMFDMHPVIKPTAVSTFYRSLRQVAR